MNIAQELERARAAAQRKDGYRARMILRKVIEQEPRNVEAWLLFAEVVQTSTHAVQCLEYILQLDPENEAARQKLNSLYAPRRIEDAHPARGNSTTSEDTNTPDKVREQLFGSDNYIDHISEEEPQEDIQTYLTAPSISEEPMAGENSDVASRASRGAGLEETFPESTYPGADSLNNMVLGKGMTKQSVASDPSGVEHRSAEALPKRRMLRLTLMYLELALMGLTFGLLLCGLAGMVFLYLDGDIILQSIRAATPTPDPIVLTNVVIQYAQASNAKDLAASMALIHPQSPIYAATLELLKNNFEMYDLSYEIADVEVIELNELEAQISFVLTTRKIRSSDYRDNRVTGVLFLRQDNGIWKIYNQRIDRIEYLDAP